MVAARNTQKEHRVAFEYFEPPILSLGFTNTNTIMVLPRDKIESSFFRGLGFKV